MRVAEPRWTSALTLSLWSELIEGKNRIVFKLLVCTIVLWRIVSLRNKNPYNRRCLVYLSSFHQAGQLYLLYSKAGQGSGSFQTLINDFSTPLTFLSTSVFENMRSSFSGSSFRRFMVPCLTRNHHFRRYIFIVNILKYPTNFHYHRPATLFEISCPLSIFNKSVHFETITETFCYIQIFLHRALS